LRRNGCKSHNDENQNIFAHQITFSRAKIIALVGSP